MATAAAGAAALAPPKRLGLGPAPLTTFGVGLLPTAATGTPKCQSICTSAAARLSIVHGKFRRTCVATKMQHDPGE